MLKTAGSLFVSLFVFTNSAFANCEAGGYFIHTTAKYHTDVSMQVLKGLASEPKRVYGSGELMDSTPPEGEYKLVNSSLKCKSVTLKKKSFMNSWDQQDFTYSIANCPEMDDGLVHYYFFDTLKRTIAVSKSLEITSKDTKNVNSKIELDAKKILETTSLSPESPSDGPGEMTIDKKDIVNYVNFPFSHTHVGKTFSMSIALLEIKNLQNYFKISRDPEIRKKYDDVLKLKTIVFPVIYFTMNAKTYYIGDGSYCSERPVREFVESLMSEDSSSKKQTVNTSLGSIHTFAVTNAYDINNDGEPDVLQINNAFSYWIKENGELYVIEAEWAC